MAKFLQFAVLISISASAWAFKSYFASTVEGINTPNTHALDVDKEGYVTLLRGMAPRNQQEIEDLIDFGVTDFLIFKNQTKAKKVDKQIAVLEEFGFEGPDSDSDLKYHHIPFPWRHTEGIGFKEACEMTVDGLNLMRDVHVSDGRALFFHCTMGEDRTGMLSGLYRVWKGEDLVEIFYDEMCAKGYAMGSPKKIWKVVKQIREFSTPLYIQMAALLAEQEAFPARLDKTICENEPELDTSLELLCERPEHHDGPQ